MFTVRNNTFETNSSSTHSLIIDTEEKIKDFKNGTLWRVESWSASKVAGMELVDRQFIIDYIENSGDADEEFIKELKAADNDNFEMLLAESQWCDDFISFGSWSSYLEWEEGKYTSPSGDKLAWVAKYGYDG